MENTLKTNIRTAKIKLTLVSSYDEDEHKKYMNEVYSYLRDAMWGQNMGMNIVLDRTREAYRLGRGADTIKEIIYSYQHQAPLPNDKKENFLKYIQSVAPIDDDFIDEKINELIEKNKTKKNPSSDKVMENKCETERKKYKKYIDKSKEEMQREIDLVKNYCAYPEDVYKKFPNGLSTPSYIAKQVQDYWKQPNVKMNVIYSLNEKLRYVKADAPLLIPPNIFYNKKNKLVGLTYNYDSYEEFTYDLMQKRNAELYFTMPYKAGEDKLLFKMTLGNINKSIELRTTIKRIFDGEYKIRGSKIGFTKNKKSGNKTSPVLFLTFESPVNTNYELDENVVVGVDLGVKIACTCALNHDKYPRRFIGNGQNLFNKKLQFDEELHRLQSSLSLAKGGHGRKRKFRRLERLKEKEVNWSKTECRKYAKEVIKFALKYHAKYINLEQLKGYKSSPEILRGWSFYRIQEYIIQAANKYGIIIRKINPCYTSQVCSECGCWHPENRPKGKYGQAYFHCHNEKCSTNHSDYTPNADYNAARNIAMSELFVEDNKEIGKEEKKRAREYYYIPEPEKDEDDEAA